MGISVTPDGRGKEATATLAPAARAVDREIGNLSGLCGTLGL